MWACARLCGLLLACGCASAPRGPFFDDDQYLVLGVDPMAEADAMAARLVEAGYRVEPRFAGRHFSALGFVDAAGTALGVRVVTGRGIELVLDPVEGDVFTQSVRFRLLLPPLTEHHDADGDGFEELFVERITGAASERCVLVYRARDSGFVDSVTDGVALAGEPRRDEVIWLEPYYCELEPAAGGEPDTEPKPGPETDPVDRDPGTDSPPSA